MLVNGCMHSSKTFDLVAGSFCEGKPVYLSSDGNYLWDIHISGYGWGIGTGCGATSASVINNNEAAQPYLLTTGWKCAASGNWVVDPDFSVTCLESSDMISCPSGQGSTLVGNCETCAAGKFNGVNEVGGCDVCQAGKFSLAGASICTSCPAGFSNTPGSASCPLTQCQIVSLSGCELAQPGLMTIYYLDENKTCDGKRVYKSLSGKHLWFEDKPQYPGTSWMAGNGGCGSQGRVLANPSSDLNPFDFSGQWRCWHGYWREFSLTAQCLTPRDCALGRGLGHNGDCVICSVGKFSDTTGPENCKDCVTSTFTDSVGQSICSQCPTGTYSDRGSSSCHEYERVVDVGTMSQLNQAMKTKAGFGSANSGDVITIAPGTYNCQSGCYDKNEMLALYQFWATITCDDTHSATNQVSEPDLGKFIIANIFFKFDHKCVIDSSIRQGNEPRRCMFIDGSGDGTLSISNIRFINGYSGYGGAMYVVTAVVMTIVNCEFENHSVVNSSGEQFGGGAIHIYFGNTVTIADCRFQGNSAPKGKDVQVNPGGTLLIAGSLAKSPPSLSWEEINMEATGIVLKGCARGMYGKYIPDGADGDSCSASAGAISDAVR